MMGIVRAQSSAAARAAIVGAVIVCGLSVPPGVVYAQGPLGKSWPASQQVSLSDIDHSAFDKLLKKYVDDDGYVDYKRWKASKADRAALQSYLDQLSRGSRAQPATKDAKLAFWINAYNAVTIEGILREYPTTSIRNHTAKLFGYNIWSDLPLRIGDGQFSLEQIEHKILRKMKEPRIHFAIVCASVGCPRLRNEAYTAKRIQQQLADNARDFFSRSSNFRAHPQQKRIEMSAILDWFGEDFGSTQAQRMKYLAPYLPAGAKSLALAPSTTIEYIDYDWSLNDQAKRKS